MEVRVHPIQHLQPINLTDFGKITCIRGRSFVAGVLPIKVGSDSSHSLEYGFILIPPGGSCYIQKCTESDSETVTWDSHPH